jgi:hypothetical protein
MVMLIESVVCPQCSEAFCSMAMESGSNTGVQCAKPPKNNSFVERTIFDLIVTVQVRVYGSTTITELRSVVTSQPSDLAPHLSFEYIFFP